MMLLLISFPPDETRGFHVKSATFLFKTRGELAEFTWFVRWVVTEFTCE